jgi:cytochrome c-type biogenesis protein
VGADYVALFGAGVGSFLAPCVVPLVPAYIGLVVGESIEARDPGRAVPATIVFVLGFAAVFAALGVSAGWIGSSLSAVQDWVQRIGGVLIVVMGLLLLGVLRGPLAREWRLVPRLPERISTLGPARPFVIGVAFGAAWSPCIGPLLGAALVVAADSEDPVRGGGLLLAYALGIGVPFVLASLVLASWPRLGPRLQRVGPVLDRVAGVLLVGLGLLLVTGAYTHISSYLARFTPAVGGL